jgi:L-ascorbate metabolism protein UlaG (beta-lactamase superfamily)
MVITYHGGVFFKVVFGDTTVAINPISKDSNLKQARFGADIALASVHHPDMSGVENVIHGERIPFVIDGPGEYEVKKVTVRGFNSESKYDGVPRINTVYLITLEGMRLCFLGVISTKKLSPELSEVLDNIDILFVPVGAQGTLDAAQAHEISVEIGAKVVIPSLYDDKTLRQYLKEEGSGGVTPVDKLTIKKKDLEEREGEIIVLKA